MFFVILELGLIVENLKCVEAKSASLDVSSLYCDTTTKKDDNNQGYRKVSRMSSFKSTNMVETDHIIHWEYDYRVSSQVGTQRCCNVHHNVRITLDER